MVRKRKGNLLSCFSLSLVISHCCSTENGKNWTKMYNTRLVQLFSDVLVAVWRGHQ